MFEISIESELKQLSKQLGVLEKDAYPKAAARTINRVASSARSASGKHIAPQMNAKQADIKRNMVIEKAYKNKLWASITAIGKPLKLIAFKARATAKGVVAKAWNVSKLYRGTFIAHIKHGNASHTVYKRKTKHSLPVKALYGPGIAQLFKRPENIEIMQSKVEQRLEKEFKNNMQFYVRRFIK